MRTWPVVRLFRYLIHSNIVDVHLKLDRSGATLAYEHFSRDRTLVAPEMRQYVILRARRYEQITFGSDR